MISYDAMILKHNLFLLVDVSKHVDIAGKCVIEVYPTVTMFKDGEKEDEMVGVFTQADYINRISKFLCT
ncbi:hypothetical protein RMATCC62417_15357 [Rhizopus microsporus]|nr:hypothetical protein RMATCC62417_15357 [Rhizopus microsporus]